MHDEQRMAAITTPNMMAAKEVFRNEVEEPRNLELIQEVLKVITRIEDMIYPAKPEKELPEAIDTLANTQKALLRKALAKLGNLQYEISKF